jgi:pimeloyl-ACP methyl ester carboxylesterase
VAIVISYRQPGTIITERTFSVPLDHDRPDGEQIEIFGREVVATDEAAQRLPWLVFLQGGPGMAANRPIGRLARFANAQAQADYLALFRADSIVADAELVRRQVTGGAPWAVLGQSFGGFCTVTYLSHAPEGISEAFITGGLPGLTATADDVYRLTYQKVAAKNNAHYARYPMDVERAKQVARALAEKPATLPGGGLLTVQRFQSAGHQLGMSTGSHQLHYLLEDPFAGQDLSDDFLYRVQAQLTFASAPLYAVLHEPCYAQGAATQWSAQRILGEFAEFDPARAIEGDEPLIFTGEMVYPWAVSLDPALVPLAECAQLLARRDSWPRLYDRARLARTEVPAAAAVYFDDMYVPQELSLPTAAAIRGLRPWVTSEYEHDGLRVSNGAVLDRLIKLARGEL